MSQKIINYDHSLVSICYHLLMSSYADCIPPVIGIGLAISTEPTVHWQLETCFHNRLKRNLHESLLKVAAEQLNIDID